MHPVASAWLAYKAHLDRQPPYTAPCWNAWLDRAVALEQHWAEQRRFHR